MVTNAKIIKCDTCKKEIVLRDAKAGYWLNNEIYSRGWAWRKNHKELICGSCMIIEKVEGKK